MRRIRLPRHLALSLGAMLFVSCSNPGWVCGCSPAEAVAVMYGRVTDGSGAGVSGATVMAEAGFQACGTTTPAVLGSARTAADGRYRMVMNTPLVPRPEDCVRAHARPPQGSTLAASDSVPFTVRFDFDGVADSVAVNLALRAP